MFRAVRRSGALAPGMSLAEVAAAPAAAEGGDEVRSRWRAVMAGRRRRPLCLIAAGVLLLAGGASGRDMPQPLAASPGDARRGKAVAVNSDLGNCVICHAIPIPELPAGATGDLGPPLAGVASRLTAADLRQRIVDPRKISPGTIMPAYFTTEGLYRVQKRYAGKTILTGQQIEDLIAFLETLK